MKMVQQVGSAMRKSAGVIVWVACMCVLLSSGPAQAQGGDQLFTQAEQALANGQNEEAVELYSQAIRSAQLGKETLAEAFLKRGRAQQLTGKHARAVADFTNALWLSSLSESDVARAYGWRGASRQALGQEKLATDDLSKARSLDPQFAAGPVPAPTHENAQAGTVAQSESDSDSSSGGLIDRIFGGGSEPARPRVAERRVSPAPTDAPSDSSGGEGAGLLSSLFGGSEDSNAQSGKSDAGVTVRPVEAPPPPSVSTTVSDLAPAQHPPERSGQPDLLSQILPPSPGAPSGEEPFGPRAKPRATAGASSPTQLTSLGAQPASAPATNDAVPAPARPSEEAQDGPSLLSRIFGGTSGESPRRTSTAQQPSPAPVRQEPVTVSESRVASAPPWQLGAENATAAEERAGLSPQSSSSSSGFFSPTRTARPERRAQPPTRVASLGAQPVDAPPPAPRATVQAGAAPAPASPILLQQASPAPPPLEARNVARISWSDATQVQRIAPPPALTAPAAPAAPSVINDPAPVPQLRRATAEPDFAVTRSAPPPALRRDIGPAVPPPAATPVAAPGQSITSRIFQVAEQAFGGGGRTPLPARQQRVASADAGQTASGWGTTTRRAPTPAPKPRTVASTSRETVSPAPSGGGGYAVQIAAERTLDAAQAKAGAVGRKHGDLLAGAKPYIVKAEVPGKGTFYRVRVGPYTGSQQVAALCQQLKGRGQDCFTTRR